MKRKPDPRIETETRRLILEKLVMGRNWMHNHVEQRNIPKGLPKLPNMSWYHEAKHDLKREGLLIQFREHGRDLYGLNIKRKAEIEKLVGA